MPYWVHSAPDHHQPARNLESTRRCSRGDRCTSGQPGPGDNGEDVFIPAWADSPSPFCRRDHRAVMYALVALPARYADLRSKLGEKPPAHGDKIRLSRTAPVPLRLDYDALMYDVDATLTSWEARVQTAAQLAASPALAARRRHMFRVAAATRVLEAHFDLLLSLPPAVMTRLYPLSAQLAVPPGATGCVHPYAGFAEIHFQLDGPAAGRELLALNQRARSLLGETVPPRERLIGVPCKHCDALALEDALPEYKSHCTECGHLLTEGEYRDHVTQWAVWARAQQHPALPEAS